MVLEKRFLLNIFNNHWMNKRYSLFVFLILDLIIIFIHFLVKGNSYLNNNITQNLIWFSSLWILFSYLTERYYDLKKFRIRRKYIYLLYFLYKTLITVFLIISINIVLYIFKKNDIILSFDYFINLASIYGGVIVLNILISFFIIRNVNKKELWIFLGYEFKKNILQKEISSKRGNIILEGWELVENNSKEIKNIDGIIIDDNPDPEKFKKIISKLKLLEELSVISTLDWCNRYLEKYPSSIFDQNQILLKSQYFSNINSFSRVKRLGDLLLSSFLLFITFPIIFLAGLIIYLQDKGPIFYSQKRTGKNGKIFIIRKLRTMRIDAENKGVQWANRDDSRITKIGKILRMTRIDELPQLLCVIKGEMSLIGPRPERPEIDEKLIESIANYELRYKVLPGLSGWAQINYPYGASLNDAREKLSYDLYYVRNMSIPLDFLICIRTMRLIWNMKGALPK